METVKLVHGSILSFLIAFAISSGILFFGNRKLQPIRAREPFWITLLLIIPALISAIGNIVAVLVDLNVLCISWAVVTYTIGGNGYFLGFAWLMVQLCSLFETQLRKLQHVDELKRSSSPGTREIETTLPRHTHSIALIGSLSSFLKYFPRFAISLCVLSNAGLILALAVHREKLLNIMYLDGECVEVSRFFEYSETAVLGLMVLLSFILSRTLSKAEDNFLLKREMIRIAFILLYQFSMTFVYKAFAGTYGKRFPTLLSYTPIVFEEIPCFLLTYFCLFEIYLESRNQHRRATALNVQNAEEETRGLVENLNAGYASSEEFLQAILENEFNSFVLREFMIKEFCVEGLLFVEEVRNFWKCFGNWTVDQRIQGAMVIVSAFIIESSPLAVNIESEKRTAVLTFFEDEDASIHENLQFAFDRAYEEVFQLIASDVLLRFQLSEDYRKLKRM
jgi:hypothetical protein